MSSATYPRSAATIRRQVVSALQQTTARTLPSVFSQDQTRMPPHASSASRRMTARPSRFQKVGSMSNSSDTNTTIASSSNSAPLSLAPTKKGASRFQKPGSISSASDTTTSTITSSTESAYSVSLRSLNPTQQSAATGFQAPPPSLASNTTGTSRFSRFQQRVVRPIAADTTSTIATSTGSEFTRESFSIESYASSSLASEDAYPTDIHSAASAIVHDWTINSNLSIVEKEVEPTNTADIPEEVYLPPRFSSDYFIELEGKKLAADAHLYGQQKDHAVNLARFIAEGSHPRTFNAEGQRVLREMMITTIMKITKLDDDVVKGRVANCYLDYVETAYDLTRPLPEDADASTTANDEDVAPFRNPSVQDADRLIDAMALGVENAFPVFRQFLMKRQEAFLANATYKALTLATATRRKLRARLMWEEEQKRQQLLEEERRAQAERQLSSAATTKSGRKSKLQTIEVEMFPDGNPPADRFGVKYTPEQLAATEKEDNLIHRWANKLGWTFGEEGMTPNEIGSFRWRKVLAQIRWEYRETNSHEEKKRRQKEEEEKKARELRRQPLPTVYEETENSTITSTICDTIYSVTSNLVKSVLWHMGYK